MNDGSLDKQASKQLGCPNSC